MLFCKLAPSLACRPLFYHTSLQFIIYNLGVLRHLSSQLVVCSDLGVLWISPGIGRGKHRVGENEQCSHPSAALSFHARASALGDLTIRLAATRSKKVMN